MPRKSQESMLREKVREYLAIAEVHLPEESSIDVKTVAVILKVSRTTLYKYSLDKEIQAAAERQHKRVKTSGSGSERQGYADIIRNLRQELQRERERNKKLVERLVLAQTNAGRLMVDIEELFKPLPKPIRTIARAGSRNPKRLK